MVPVFGYVRCSGLSQCKEDKDGFIRQGEAITAFCQSGGYELKAAFIERGVSGKTDEAERPAYSAMLGTILGNGVRTVIVENLSRLAREYRIQEELLLYMAGKGVDLISADTGENITKAMMGDPMKKAIVQIQGVFFELERSMLVNKLQVAKQRKRARGERCDGPKPFGEQGGESATVERIKALRSGGMTIAKITEELNASGTVARHDGAKWHATSVARILRRVA